MQSWFFVGLVYFIFGVGSFVYLFGLLVCWFGFFFNINYYYLTKSRIGFLNSNSWPWATKWDMQQAGRCSPGVSPPSEALCIGWPWQHFPRCWDGSSEVHHAFSTAQQAATSPAQGSEIHRDHNSGCSTPRHANPFVALAWSKWLTCTIRICRPFVTKGILNCSISMRLLGWTRFVGSSPVFGVMGQSDLWRHFCGSCRGGRGPGVTGFLPLKGRSFWQYTLPAADLPIKQITKHCPGHKQTPLLYIQSSAQTELNRTLQNKFESNINVHPGEKDEGKTHASNSFSPWRKSRVMQQDRKVKILVKWK